MPQSQFSVILRTQNWISGDSPPPPFLLLPDTEAFYRTTKIWRVTVSEAFQDKSNSVTECNSVVFWGWVGDGGGGLQFGQGEAFKATASVSPIGRHCRSPSTRGSTSSHINFEKNYSPLWRKPNTFNDFFDCSGVDPSNTFSLSSQRCSSTAVVAFVAAV